ncbi:MAG TPA: response regulator transcription factor [Gammaproteobacteria bacterium]|nr:response regulator transcription factor [Gammaproteobacteria bacterium]
MKSRSLLVVDDDETFRQVLAGALTSRGYAAQSAGDAQTALSLARSAHFDDAVVDLRLPGASGLTLIEQLRRANPDMRIVVLTGYASIATAVEAIKLGAVHYLTKPADADEIVAALAREEGASLTPVVAERPSVKRLEWEHIQKVLNDSAGNVSEAARRLRMHRRTLQRKLKKRPVRQ